MIAPKLDEFAVKYADTVVFLKVNQCIQCSHRGFGVTEWQFETDRIVFFQVDVDDCEELAVRFDISSMPTFVYLKNGVEVEKFSGANTNKLEELITQHAA